MATTTTSAPPQAPPSTVVDSTTVQGPARIRAALSKVTGPRRVDPVLVSLGIALWIGFAALVTYVPDDSSLPLKDASAIDATQTVVAVAGLAIAAAGALLWLLSRTHGRVGAVALQRLSHGTGWFIGSAIYLLLWEVSTAKAGWLESPYFVSSRAVLHGLWTDRGILSESLGNSLLLLAVGFAVGLLAGLVTGVTIGWFQTANYWVHPVLIFIGPVPSLAWVPIVFVLFPSAYAGAVFMIALSVWFPVTVLTRAGILSVPRSYFDVAQTLGARPRFLVLRVALPAALPSIFTGAFMALGSSFVSLTVAENFGVNSGLGWYLNWKKGFGDYTGLYAGLLVLLLVCGLLLTLLFRARHWVLRWEKELTRW